MPTSSRPRTYLPPHLEVPTVGNAPMDEIGLIPQYALVIYPGVNGQEVYVDGTRALDKSKVITWGRIAIMHCIGWSGEIGIVGDLRYSLSPQLFDTVQRDEVPDDVLADQTLLDEWRSERGERPLAAIAYMTPEGTREFMGDRDFYPATAKLTELVDDLLREPDSSPRRSFHYARAQVYGYIANMGHFLSGV